MTFLLAVSAFIYCVYLGKTKSSKSEVAKLQSELKRLRSELNSLSKQHPTQTVSQEFDTNDAAVETDLTTSIDIPQVQREANIESLEDTSVEPAINTDSTNWPQTDTQYKKAGPTYTEASVKKPIKSGPSYGERLISNISQNWIIWVAALSLAMGGIFFIRYGIERGILGPRARVFAAMTFGLIMIGAAEYFRRKKSLGMQDWFSVPSIFATGGLASLFSAAVGAHLLYGLIGATTSFVFTALISLLSIALGMIYGPVLAVLGILGAFATPLIVGSDSGATPILYLYFLMILAAALCVERYMRWIWLSAFAVGLALLQGALLLLTHFGNEPYTAVYSGVIIWLTLTIPAFGLRPHTPYSTPAIEGIKDIPRHYPTVLAAATSLAAVFLIVSGAAFGSVAEQSSLVVLMALSVWAVFWLYRAENLDEQSIIFVFGILSICALTKSTGGDTAQIKQFSVETIALLLTSGLTFIASFWRGERSVRPLAWIAGGTVVPIVAFAQHYAVWRVGENLFTDQQWALWALAVAILFTVAAVCMFRSKLHLARQGADLYTIGTLIATGFAAYFLVPKDFHAHASAVLAIVALGLFTSFKLSWTKHMVWAFVTAATALAMYRLFPELMSQHHFTWFNLLSFAAICAPLVYGYMQASRAQVTSLCVLFETAALLIFTATIVALLRNLFAKTGNLEYLELGFYAALALVMAGVQLRRANVAQNMQTPRTVLAIVYTVGAAISYIGAVAASPLWFDGALAHGIPPVSTVFLAYSLAPALLTLGVWKTDFIELSPQSNTPLFAVGALIISFVVIQEVRHFWHGPEISLLRGVLGNELYTYTVMMLVATISLVFLALKRQDTDLRRYALIAAALTAAKVFAFDMSGMAGLTRATAFILLGLSLAGIGWLLQGMQEKNEA